MTHQYHGLIRQEPCIRQSDHPHLSSRRRWSHESQRRPLDRGDPSRRIRPLEPAGRRARRRRRRGGARAGRSPGAAERIRARRRRSAKGDRVPTPDRRHLWRRRRRRAAAQRGGRPRRRDHAGARHRVLQQPGTVAPNAFLVPMRKSDAWWEKGWMERHTYFLPRYDESGRMVNEGHTLAAEAGIGCLMRRTYKNAVEPAPAGEYDFISHFECADEHVPVFHEVCDALRDIRRNPEWQFVREGPTWHGRRVATWAELFV